MSKYETKRAKLQRKQKEPNKKTIADGCWNCAELFVRESRCSPGVDCGWRWRSEESPWKGIPRHGHAGVE